MTAEDAAAELSVTKTANPTSGVKVGDTITYTVVVENTGNVSVTDGVLTDDHADLSGESFSLAPSATATFTYTYTATQADIDAGSIVNVVTANATAARGEDPDEVTATATVTAFMNGHLTITKTTTSAPATGESYALGETITYEIAAENDGNLTITDITVTDELTGDSWTIASLAPGESSSAFTASYTVTEADVTAGRVVNVATATGVSPDPEEPEVPVTPGTDEEPTWNQYTLTVRYWYEAVGGEVAYRTFTATHKIGDTYNVGSPWIAGYVANRDRVTGTIHGDTVEDVIYTMEDYTLTILYRYTSGGQAAPTYTETLNYGDRYSVTSPTIAGYLVDRPVVNGTMPARNVTETVFYDADETTAPELVTIEDFDTPLGLGNVNLNAGEAIE